ncbi:MAG: NAD(+)/NADH kinase [Planctomycetaceae bacterium]|nr:NAD(+)/NADH kinase [Planctomycetaceae bacterium]
MRVLLLGSADRPGVLEAVEHFRPEIEKYCEIIAEDFSCSQDLSRYDADVAIIFGGDGSILRAARQMGKHQLPALSVNMGTLGFLANFTTETLIPVLRQNDILSLPQEEYLMLTCRVIRNGVTVAEQIALNEALVQSGPPFRMLEVELTVNGEEVTTYRCDGLIISTPIGSTARNLSAGGPILRNDLDVVVISPISPHTLSHRPVVDSADRTYQLCVQTPLAPVIVDGCVIATAHVGDRVLVGKSPQRFKMIQMHGFSYYQTLREKLGWGGHFAAVVEKNQ